jgi:hypothetical protein
MTVNSQVSNMVWRRFRLGLFSAAVAAFLQAAVAALPARSSSRLFRRRGPPSSSAAVRAPYARSPPLPASSATVRCRPPCRQRPSASSPPPSASASVCAPSARRPRVRRICAPSAAVCLVRPPSASATVRASASPGVLCLARDAAGVVAVRAQLSARPQRRLLAPQRRRQGSSTSPGTAGSCLRVRCAIYWLPKDVAAFFSVAVRDVCHICELLLRRLAVRAAICAHFFAPRSVAHHISATRGFWSRLQRRIHCSSTATRGFWYHQDSLSQIRYSFVLFLLFNMTSNAIVVNIVLDGQNYPEWAFCVQTALRGHGLLFHLTEDSPVLAADTSNAAAIFFLEYAGELRIFVLIEEKKGGENPNTAHTPLETNYGSPTKTCRKHNPHRCFKPATLRLGGRTRPWHQSWTRAPPLP